MVGKCLGREMSELGKCLVEKRLVEKRLGIVCGRDFYCAISFPPMTLPHTCPHSSQHVQVTQVVFFNFLDIVFGTCSGIFNARMITESCCIIYYTQPALLRSELLLTNMLLVQTMLAMLYRKESILVWVFFRKFGKC